MQANLYLYSALYADITKHPEVAIFRRRTDLWVWMLYDQSQEIHRLETECKALVAQKFSCGRLSITDVQHVHVEDDPELRDKIEELQSKNRKYGTYLGSTMAIFPWR